MHGQKKIASERAGARRPRTGATCALLPQASRALYMLLSPEQVVLWRLRFKIKRLPDIPEFVWSDTRVFPRLQDFQAFLEVACETLDVSDEELLVAVVLLEDFLRRTGRTSCPYVFCRQLLLVCLCLAIKVGNDDAAHLYGDVLSELTRASSRTLRRAEVYVLHTLDWTLSLETRQYALYFSALAEVWPSCQR